jgi:hypothetical protein
MRLGQEVGQVRVRKAGQVTLNAIYIDVEGMLSYVQLVGDFTKSEALGLVDMSKVKELETLLFGDNIPLEVVSKHLMFMLRTEIFSPTCLITFLYATRVGIVYSAWVNLAFGRKMLVQ